MTLVVLAAVAALAVLAAHGRPMLTFSVLVGTVLLMPATMVLPGSPTAALTSSRLVELAACVGVARVRHRVGAKVLPVALVPLLVYAGALAVTGVAYASTQVDPVDATYTWLGVGDQVVVALLALNLARHLTSAQLLVVLVGGAVAAGAVGLGEWVTGESWARTILRAATPGEHGVAAQRLERRAGDVRVRGATEYALAYGWLMTALLPAVVAASRVRRPIGVVMRTVVLVGTPVVVAAVVLSRGRSSLLVALVLLAATLGVLVPRRPIPLALLGLLVVGSVGWLGPDVLDRIAPSVDQTSVDVRVHRLPHVLELAAAHPFRGTGLGGIQLFGPGFVDSSYLLTYVEGGVIAAVLLVVAIAVPLVLTTRGVVLGRSGDDWLLALAAAAGMTALVVGPAFFDTFTTLSTGRTFWVLAGLGLVAAERCAGPPARPGWRDVLSPLRLLLVVAAVGTGFAVWGLWPRHATTEVLYQTVDTRTSFVSQPPGLSRDLSTTLCQGAREAISVGRPWHVSTCEEVNTPGWVQVSVTAEDAAAATAGLAELTTELRAYPGLGALVAREDVRGAVVGVPTVARAAPVGLGLLVLPVVLLAPRRRRSA